MSKKRKVRIIQSDTISGLNKEIEQSEEEGWEAEPSSYKVSDRQGLFRLFSIAVSKLVSIFLL